MFMLYYMVVKFYRKNSHASCLSLSLSIYNVFDRSACAGKLVLASFFPRSLEPYPRSNGHGEVNQMQKFQELFFCLHHFDTHIINMA